MVLNNYNRISHYKNSRWITFVIELILALGVFAFCGVKIMNANSLEDATPETKNKALT